MSDPGVDAEDVRHVAELARIELDEDRVARFRDEFETILGYFDRLEEVPAVERDDELQDVLRPDEVGDSLPLDEALANADRTEDGYFKGPPVG